MLVRRQFDREIDRSRELVDHFVRAICRAIVDDDDFEPTRHVSLERERRQRPLQMARPLERRQNYGDFQPRRHAVVTFGHASVVATLRRF